MKTISSALLFSGLAAASFGASAQATVYGILDASVISAGGSLTSITRMGSGEAAGTRLGFKVEEDMGGGLKANAVLEGGVNNANGGGSATNTNNQASGATAAGAFTFNRQAWLGLSGGWGEVHLGRDYLPTFAAVAYADPFGANGSAVMTQALVGAVGGINLPNAIRSSNAIAYVTPTMQGLTGHVMYGMGGNPSTPSATAKDGNSISARVSYKQGDLEGHFAYAKFSLVSIGDMKETVLAGTYNLGSAKLFAHYVDDKTGISNFSKGYQLGVTYAMGATELRAAWSKSALKNAAGAKIATTNKTVLGAYYNLSKRTALYTQLVFVKNADGASAVAFAGNGTTAINQGAHAYEIGVRHSF